MVVAAAEVAVHEEVDVAALLVKLLLGEWAADGAPAVADAPVIATIVLSSLTTIRPRLRTDSTTHVPSLLPLDRPARMPSLSLCPL